MCRTGMYLRFAHADANVSGMKKKVATKRARPIGIDRRRLLLAIEARGWTQTIFAREAETSLMMVNRAVNGRSGVADYTLKHWCKVLGCSADYLLNLSDSRLPNTRKDPVKKTT